MNSSLHRHERKYSGKKYMRFLKYLGKCILVFISLSAYAQENENQEIVIRNTMGFDRNELINIPYADFSKVLAPNVKEFKIVSKKDGTEYPYQIETLGENDIRNILIQVNIRANEEIQLVVKTEKADPISPKTFGRYVPERFDDFAWENDVIAFRMYGKALEGRKDDAQGIDIWAKRTNNLIVDKWYKSEDYHKDHGEGLDYYAVGQTLGAGDVAAYSNRVLYYSKHYRTYQILDNGPLRTTFKLDFEPWKVGIVNVKMSKTISIDANSQLNKIKLDFHFDETEELTMAAGIAKRGDGGEVLDMHKEGIFGYWEPPYGANGIMGVGLVFDKPIDSIVVEDNQFLSLFQVKPKTSVIYHAGGAWNRAGKIQSASEWSGYLEQFKEGLENPLEVRIN